MQSPFGSRCHPCVKNLFIPSANNFFLFFFRTEIILNEIFFAQFISFQGRIISIISSWSTCTDVSGLFVEPLMMHRWSLERCADILEIRIFWELCSQVKRAQIFLCFCLHRLCQTRHCRQSMLNLQLYLARLMELLAVKK